MSAKLIGSEAEIGVSFTTELVSALKNASGHIISGDEKAISRVDETWTFGCDITKTPRLWRLLETHDAA